MKEQSGCKEQVSTTEGLILDNQEEGSSFAPKALIWQEYIEGWESLDQPEPKNGRKGVRSYVTMPKSHDGKQSFCKIRQLL